MHVITLFTRKKYNLRLKQMCDLIKKRSLWVGCTQEKENTTMKNN